VAIVGMGGVFSGSPSLDRFWQHIRNGVDTARKVPSGRWLLDPDEAYSAELGAPDRVYSQRGCFISDFQLDAAGLDVDAAQLGQLDPLFPLVLQAGRQAFASYLRKSIIRDRIGVIL